MGRVICLFGRCFRGLALMLLLMLQQPLPGTAQPFSDIPLDHWAYRAIATLAAKGLVEGYPIGVFRGDRPMSRYEMAMVVARLLSRIESTQPPLSNTPQVTKTDLDIIQRLADEFRLELSALGIRVTTIEEELNAIRAALDHVRVSGVLQLRYDLSRAATGSAIGGNSNAKATDASSSPLLNRAKEYAKLIFDGSATSDTHLILALVTGGGGTYQTFNSAGLGSAIPGSASTQYNIGTIDNLFLDWKKAFGIPWMELWLGRFGGTIIGDDPSLKPRPLHYPVQFGPFGLLMNSDGATWSDSTANSGTNYVDGLLILFGDRDSQKRVRGDLQAQAIVTRVTGNTGAGTYFAGEDAYGFDANIQLFEPLQLGAYFVGNSITSPTSIGGAAAPVSAPVVN